MKIVVLYTMKGCPYCDMIKEELKKEEIDYINRDINEFSEEYDGTDVKCGNSSDELDSEEIIEEPVEDFFE